MQKYFATESRNLHLNPGANVGSIAPRFKCKRFPRAGKMRRTGNGRRRAGERPSSGLWPSSLGRQQNSDGSLEKPTRGENLDVFAPRLNCKMGTSLRDLTANDNRILWPNAVGTPGGSFRCSDE